VRLYSSEKLRTGTNNIPYDSATELHLAVYLGNRALVPRLISHRRGITEEDDMDQSVLDLAAYRDHFGMYRNFLPQGIAEHRDQIGQTP